MSRLLALLGLAVSLSGCPEITPPTGPGTDYPCGIGGTCCQDPDGPVISCAAGYVCRHYPARCDFQGDTIYTAKPDGGR